MKRATLVLAFLVLWTINSHAFAGSISGEVYNDLNVTGTLQGGDPGLSGWTVNLLDSNQSIVNTTTTDAGGNYSFPGVGSGTFTLQEVLQNGWDQAAPQPVPPGTYTITSTSSAVNFTGYNFGNYQFVTVSGSVYNDLNNNGVLNAGEPGLQGWTVDFLDSSNNVLATTVTNASGNYIFGNGYSSPGIPSGRRYGLAEVVLPRWDQTQPVNPNYYSFTTSLGLNLTGENFGNFSAVPEPSTLTLLGIGSLSLLGYGWRRRRQSA